MKYNGLFLVKPGKSKLTEQRAQPERATLPRSEEYLEGYNQGFIDSYQMFEKNGPRRNR